MIILTVGIPGSGKTTWVKEVVSTSHNKIRVNRDDLRLMLKDVQMLDGDGERLVTKLVEHTIANKGKNIDLIIDQTNCNLSALKKLIDFASSFDDVCFVAFPISPEEAISRNENRGRAKVPTEVINRMYKGFKEVVDYYGLDSYYPFTECATINKKVFENIIQRTVVLNGDVEKILNRPETVIFDIDGTLALMNNRSPYQWNKVGLDIVNGPVLKALKAHQSNGKKIVLLSGRDGVCRAETEEWLSRYCTYDLLLMRGVNDNRNDAIIKEELYRNYIEPNYNVICVYDDRDRVVKMWRSIGLPCFQVAEGDF